MTPPKEPKERGTAEIRARRIMRELPLGTGIDEAEKYCANQIKQAMEQAREEGFSAAREPLNLALEALEAIRDGLKRIPMNSHTNCAASYRVADKTIRQIEAMKPEAEGVK